ncbi:RhoGAP-domain-containing protein [Imleria badia]|nr:RhoGAP-domain-containing protein [Imleria badia]
MSTQTAPDPFDPVVQPRPSISEPSLQSGPLPLFDHHLRVLTDSFLNFFLERKRIEEIYVESLLKLHRKTKSIDAFLDDRTDMSTTRRAWAEIRDNVEREAQTRQAFLSTLTSDAVNSLMTLKEIQERTRKRIKEDLKESISAYSDYAENTLPKLKRSYLKKCQEVEDHKLAAASTPQPPSTATYVEPAGTSMPNSRSNPVLPSRPLVTAPQPLRPLDRRPSGTTHVARNRSPSNSGTTFSDFAQHGKKQLNQLITFLDKGSTVKETLGVRSETSALRAVRAKREADEADKEYRKGVYWLETLRLRRTKILESAYTSLENFIGDYSGTVKTILEKYTDNMTATTTTQTQLSEHARSMVTKISSEKDVSLVTTHIPRALTSLIPKPVLYYNYNVGECNDLIFGVTLVDYATSRGLGEIEIPKIVRICIQEIDERGLESEGIYRVSGRHAVVQDLQHKIERNEAAFKFNRLTDDVYAVSSLLKLYLRGLPEPLFKYTLSDRAEYSEGRVGDPSSIAQMRSKIRRLPAIHRETLRAIVEHLSRVAAFSEKNKMDVRNLAIVFATVIFGEEDIPKGGDLLSVQNVKDTRMDDLIQYTSQLFDDPLPSNSPPLPDPPGEPAPVYNYGSSHTRVGSVLPRPLSPRQNEDFTPPLPPRPAYSIHPSLRASNPVSPIQATMDIPPIPSIPYEEPTSEDTKTSAEVHIEISPPSSPSALSPYSSSVSLTAASDLSYFFWGFVNLSVLDGV